MSLVQLRTYVTAADVVSLRIMVLVGEMMCMIAMLDLFTLHA